MILTSPFINSFVSFFVTPHHYNLTWVITSSLLSTSQHLLLVQDILRILHSLVTSMYTVRKKSVGLTQFFDLSGWECSLIDHI